MTTIKANNFISSGFSADDAAKLTPSINQAVDSGTEFAVDFSGVQYFTTLFFSTALTRLIDAFGEDEYRRRLHVTNLSESGQETYNHALDYAIEYFKKTDAERALAQASINAVMEDM